ncbi:A24 family peptidase [Erwinia sp. OLCASP19]
MLSNDKEATSFILLLGIIAYCDLTTRWIPDCLLYGAVWLSLGLRSGHLLEQGITGAALFCLPVFILQGVSLLTRRKGCFASGDLYLIPAIGVWFVPGLAPALMACTLMLASLVSRYVKDVPFITCILPVFTGYKICEHFLLF